MSLMAKGRASRGSGGPEGILREIQVNLLECKVCFEKFTTQQMDRRPQNLSCGHVLCLECVSALSHPLLRKLECPFCRQLCSVETTSHCQVLRDLQEILQTTHVSGHKSAQSSSGLKSPAIRYLKSFGGWGTLMNPAGMAMLGSSGTTVVVHDGEKRVVVFNDGREVHSFGEKEQKPVGICYPVDVAVTASGNVVVTDAGEHAVKVFTSRGAHLVTISGHFELPWGVDTNSDGHILVSDVQAGTLSIIKVDYKHAVVRECGSVVSDLQNPKSVACCRVRGSTAVIEHLSDPKMSPRKHLHTRLTVFTEDFHVLYQTDSFSLMLHLTVHLSMSAVAFDVDGGLLVVDSDHGMLWSLESKSQNGSVHVTPVVSEHLVRPVAVVSSRDALMILDGGDHTVKMYSSLHAEL